MKVPNAKLNLVSFPDCTVLSFELLESIRSLEILIDGAFMESSPSIFFKSAKLLLKKWDGLWIRYFDAEAEKWYDVNSPDFDTLKDICEFVISDDVILRGFGKYTGQWLEFQIKGGKISLWLY